MNNRAIAAVLASGALALATGCGLQPSGVEEGPSAPTGVAPGVTLYFLDHDGELIAQQRETGRLGSISEAVSLLLTGPGDSDVLTGIDPTLMTRTEVTASGEILNVRVPLASTEMSDAGIDQIVCTALAAHIQAGGSPQARVGLARTDRDEEPRTCPVLG